MSIDPHIWGGDEASKTFRKEFLERHAPELVKDPFIMMVASRLARAVHTPVVVISASLPDKPVQIVIRGFPAEYSPETSAFERTLYSLLKGLKEAERRSWSPGRG